MARNEDDEGVRFEETKVVAQTDRAVLVKGEAFDDGELWIPRSVIHDDSEVWKQGDQGRLILKGWWARENGLEDF